MWPLGGHVDNVLYYLNSVLHSAFWTNFAKQLELFMSSEVLMRDGFIIIIIFLIEMMAQTASGE